MHVAIEPQRKCWGEVRHCFASPAAAVSYLEVVEGAWCSRHWHADRVNMFVVLTGKIIVEEWEEGGAVGTHCLGPGDAFTVPANVIHRFSVLESGQVIEIYYPSRSGATVRADDIFRIDEGGRRGD